MAAETSTLHRLENLPSGGQVLQQLDSILHEEPARINLETRHISWNTRVRVCDSDTTTLKSDAHIYPRKRMLQSRLMSAHPSSAAIDEDSTSKTGT
jgi:hypothetical protein